MHQSEQIQVQKEAFTLGCFPLGNPSCWWENHVEWSNLISRGMHFLKLHDDHQSYFLICSTKLNTTGLFFYRLSIHQGVPLLRMQTLNFLLKGGRIVYLTHTMSWIINANRYVNISSRLHLCCFKVFALVNTSAVQISWSMINKNNISYRID